MRDMVTKKRQRKGHWVGDRNPQTRLTWDDVRAIRLVVANGAVQRRVAEQFNVTAPVVNRIVRQHSWRENV